MIWRKIELAYLPVVNRKSYVFLSPLTVKGLNQNVDVGVVSLILSKYHTDAHFHELSVFDY